MQNSNIPAKFPIPWASSAGGAFIRSVPTASQIGIQNGAASLTDGFPPLNFLPVASGGFPPFGQDTNGILKQITQWSQWQQAGGAVFYDGSFQTSIGGYPAGAIVASGAYPGVYWRSLLDNNTNNPDAGAVVGWIPAFGFPTIGQHGLISSTSIGAAFAGQFINIGGSGTTQTLPSATSFPGMSVGFYATTAFTLASAGGNIFGSAGPVSSIDVAVNQWVCVQSDGTNWRIFSSSFSSGFPTGFGNLSSSTSIGAAFAGQFINIGGSGTTQTLPSATSFPGMTVGFYATTTAFTLASAGGNIFGSAGPVSSIDVAVNQWVCVQSDGTNWRIFSSSFSSGFPTGFGNLSSSTALDGTLAGQFINIGGSGTTQTLPSATSFPGMTVGFYATTTAFTLASAGGNIFGSAGPVSSIDVAVNQWVCVQSDGTNWRIFSSSFPTGLLLNIQTFATPGVYTYTPTAGARSLVVEVQGGCGGSAGIPATTSGQFAFSPGANSGAYALGEYLATSQTVTVGAAGAAGTAGGGGGGAGGSSSFGSLMTAGGGVGSSSQGPAAFTVFASQATTTSNATATGGNIINLSGTTGGYSIGGASPAFSVGGIGAIAPRGQAGAGAAQAGSASAVVGNAGTAGMVIVFEYS